MCQIVAARSACQGWSGATNIICCCGSTPMWGLFICVILMIAGDALDVGIGALASNMWGDPISLPIFLACYFVTLALAWLAAVKIAESMELTTSPAAQTLSA